MSVDGTRKHPFLKNLLFRGLSGNHKCHVANEPRAAATFYSTNTSLACMRTSIPALRPVA